MRVSLSPDHPASIANRSLVGVATHWLSAQWTAGCTSSARKARMRCVSSQTQIIQGANGSAGKIGS
jgi:hypothetical protein